MSKQVITALATPFLGGRIDVDSYLKLLEKQKQASCDVLVAGATAEGALLTVRERKLLMGVTREYLPDAKMWVGVSSGITKRAIREAYWAETLGADGIMVCPPAFFKCTADGFFEHIRLIKRSCNLPIMLYNAPSRCGYALWKDTVTQLAKKGWIDCIKDAGVDADYAKEIAKHTTLYCGNEEKLAEFVNAGASGVVSVVSNVNPALTQKAANCARTVYKAKRAAELHNELTQNLFENYSAAVTSPEVLKAKETYLEYMQLVKLAFAELNPIAVKYMLYKMGTFRSFEMRLPLSAANQNTRQLIDRYLR